jgi:hypothetical protein
MTTAIAFKVVVVAYRKLYRTPRKTRFAAARWALPRPSSQTADFNALVRRYPHRSRRALLTHRAPPSGRTPYDERSSVARRPRVNHSTVLRRIL